MNSYFAIRHTDNLPNNIDNVNLTGRSTIKYSDFKSIIFSNKIIESLDAKGFFSTDITSRCFGSKRCVFMQNNEIKTNTENLLFYPEIYANNYPKISTNGKNLVDIFTAWKGVEDYNDRIIISHIDP